MRAWDIQTAEQCGILERCQALLYGGNARKHKNSPLAGENPARGLFAFVYTEPPRAQIGRAHV